MDFSLSEEQVMLKKVARDFFEKECTEKFVREIEAGEVGYSPEQWKKVAELGWLGFIFPEKYNGLGGSLLDMAVIYEEMGRAMFPSPHLSTVILCGLTILKAGSEQQKTDLLSSISDGKLVMALALTEPKAAWDGNAWEPSGVTLAATAQGGDYVLNGSKMFVLDAKVAAYLMCVARTGKAARPEDGITLFLVDAKSKGITTNLLVTTAGDKQCEVIFENVKVPKTSVIGEVNKGWAPLESAIQQGAVLLCASMIGASQKLLELSIEYSKTRVQFEQPIGIHQYVQEHCVNLLTEIDTSWWLTYYAAWKLSQGMPADFDVAVAKAWVSNSHERGCWFAHQVHGGVGYTVEDGVLPMYSRRGKAMQLMLGDSKHHLEKVALELEKMPAPPKPRGKALHLWEGTDEQRTPDWFARFERGESVEKGKKS
jgi:3-oxocholest-4-en-26-oyl-CoA dehydrogenase beta subunit